jgi:hypothetical protein
MRITGPGPDRCRSRKRPCGLWAATASLVSSTASMPGRLRTPLLLPSGALHGALKRSDHASRTTRARRRRRARRRPGGTDDERPTWKARIRRGAGAPTRHVPAARAVAQQGHGIHRGREGFAGASRSPAPPRALAGGTAGAGARELPPQDVGSREVHRPERPARPQRGTLLPYPRGQPGGDAADHLHADRGPRLPAVRQHLPEAQGDLRQRP